MTRPMISTGRVTPSVAALLARALAADVALPEVIGLAGLFETMAARPATTRPANASSASGAFNRATAIPRTVAPASAIAFGARALGSPRPAANASAIGTAVARDSSVDARAAT